MHQEAPRHEAVLGRKVRRVIWDTTRNLAGGKGREKITKNIWEKEKVSVKGGSKERPAVAALGSMGLEMADNRRRQRC